jgi:hypothetical protein
MYDMVSKFLIAGWKYLHSTTDGSVCSDRSCLRCRLADILFEVEKMKLTRETSKEPKLTPDECSKRTDFVLGGPIRQEDVAWRWKQVNKEEKP